MKIDQQLAEEVINKYKASKRQLNLSNNPFSSEAKIKVFNGEYFTLRNFNNLREGDLFQLYDDFGEVFKKDGVPYWKIIKSPYVDEDNKKRIQILALNDNEAKLYMTEMKNRIIEEKNNTYRLIDDKLVKESNLSV
jgi:hypothetical protein